MAQKYKVFINDTPVFFQETLEDVNKHQKGKFLESSDTLEIQAFIDKNTPSSLPLIIVGKNVFSDFFSSYKIIEAAGGLVLNNQNEILFILRLGKWDLPKGKLEYGEKTDEAALREVQEECGVEQLEIIKSLSNTYHTYTIKDKKVLKITYWYLMKTNFNGKLIPQTEEDIEKVEWISLKKSKEIVFKNTYGAIKDVISEFEMEAN